MHLCLQACLIAAIPAAFAGFPRWESRTVDCVDPSRCRQIDHLGAVTPCVFEVDPDDGVQRQACPLTCPTAHRLSAVLRSEYQNYQHCLNFYNYKKERREDDWYMWVKPPCEGKIQTWCQFNDVGDDNQPSENGPGVPENDAGVRGRTAVGAGVPRLANNQPTGIVAIGVSQGAAAGVRRAPLRPPTSPIASGRAQRVPPATRSTIFPPRGSVSEGRSLGVNRASVIERGRRVEEKSTEKSPELPVRRPAASSGRFGTRSTTPRPARTIATTVKPEETVPDVASLNFTVVDTDSSENATSAQSTWDAFHSNNSSSIGVDFVIDEQHSVEIKKPVVWDAQSNSTDIKGDYFISAVPRIEGDISLSPNATDDLL